MGTLYIDRKDVEIRSDGGAIAFYTNGKRDGGVPIKPFKRVVICGKVTIDSTVLHRLADANISVLLLSGKSLRFRGILHGRLHNNGLLRLRQYEKALSEFSVEWSVKLVKEKIAAALEFLRDVLERRSDCRSELLRVSTTLEGVIESLDETPLCGKERLRGLEGGAAAAFFSAYTVIFPPSLGFNKRNRRPPTDPVNAILSLTYTLLHWEIVREIEVIGLDPTIGFYHDFDYGRESLACDLIEPLRPLADRWIWKLFRERNFTVRDFSEGDERPGCYLKKGGRKKFYLLYEQWAGDMRGTIRESVRELARIIADKGVVKGAKIEGAKIDANTLSERE